MISGYIHREKTKHYRRLFSIEKVDSLCESPLEIKFLWFLRVKTKQKKLAEYTLKGGLWERFWGIELDIKRFSKENNK